MSELKVVSVYELGSTNGYTFKGDAVYFTNKDSAVEHAKMRHGNYGRTQEKKAVMINDEEFYVLVSDKKRALFDTEKEKEQRRQTALAKLSKEEKELLGLV